jgi:outer membrane protein assembly factor BamD
VQKGRMRYSHSLPKRLKAIVILFFLLSCMSSCSYFGFGKKDRQDSPEELMNKGMNEFRKGDYKEAVELFQKVKDRYPYSKLAVHAELKLADSLFKRKEFEEAAEAYTEFERLHPRNEAIPYVIYQQGMCHFLRMNDIDRDQTSAKNALKEFERLQRKFPDDPFSRMAETRIRKCISNLAEHEFYVGRFYYKSGHYVAALKRFEYLINHYPDAGQYEKTLVYIAKCKEKLAQQETDH